jgi:hypothetical protein
MTGFDRQKPLEAPASIRALLVADGLPDLLFIEPHGGHAIASRPEMFTREIALFALKLPGDGNCALPFQKPDHRRHRVLGPEGDAEVSVSGHQMTFHYRTLLLACQCVKDRA